MVIELAGLTSSGKSTLYQKLASSFVSSRTVFFLSPETLSHFVFFGRRVSRLNFLTLLISILTLPLLLTIHPKFLFSSFVYLMFFSRGKYLGRVLLFLSLVRKLLVFNFCSLGVFSRYLFVCDEGVSQMPHNLASQFNEEKHSRIFLKSILNMIPSPDCLIFVRQNTTVISNRNLARSDRPRKLVGKDFKNFVISANKNFKYYLSRLQTDKECDLIYFDPKDDYLDFIKKIDKSIAKFS